MNPSFKQHQLFHVICYYLLWYSCLHFAAVQQAWIGMTISLGIFATQLVWQFQIAQKTQQLIGFILLLTLCGLLIDSTMVWLNLIVYADNYFYPYLCPPWLLILFAEFALSLYALTPSLLRRPLAAAALALIGFPLSYLAATHLGAAQLVYGFWSAGVIGLLWAITLPVVLLLYFSKGETS